MVPHGSRMQRCPSTKRYHQAKQHDHDNQPQRRSRTYPAKARVRFLCWMVWMLAHLQGTRPCYLLDQGTNHGHPLHLRQMHPVMVHDMVRDCMPHHHHMTMDQLPNRPYHLQVLESLIRTQRGTPEVPCLRLGHAAWDPHHRRMQHPTTAK
mmetsp:Transcript_67841/g.189385  ORF Transcript_67841/g.189385 Transcript_67841/m.189385 type:complete len:151 (+) Transcript_67841:647-1099(+)